MIVRRRRLLLTLGVVVAALAIAIPVFAADPSLSPNPSGSTKALATPDAGGSPDTDASAKPDKSPKPEKPAKADKGPEVPVTVTGTVARTTDGQGRPAFTLTAGGKTWDLSAGPPWFWGDKNPLKAYVGKSVTIIGSTHTGDTEVDVETVDGKAIRAAGKPPWAGGPWVVGPTHPGWKPWMADGKPGKGPGREHAPGQLKDKDKTTTD